MSDGALVIVFILAAILLFMPPVLVVVAEIVAVFFTAVVRIGGFVLIVGLVGIMGALLVMLSGNRPL